MSAEGDEDLLAGSELFAGIDRAHVAEVARSATRVAFARDEAVVVRGEPAHALFVLVDGELRLSFASAEPGSADAEEDRRGSPPGRELALWTDQPGYALGWSAAMDPPSYRATVTAMRETSMLRLERAALDVYAQEHPDFALAFARRTLWIAGARLRSVRLRLVTGRFSTQQEAITSMLSEHAASLPVTSALHRIPYLLGHRLTVDDALATLDRLAGEGEPMERELALIVRDQLHEVRAELVLFRHLQRIYELVASAPAERSAEEIRQSSLEEFQRLFAQTRHLIVGREHLPAEPGHVFVMNHLVNHPDNLLPNDFILTLDTHFVASMILLERYGTAPIRVVRKSRPHERGHQRFFDRLGYLYVYSGHVEPEPGQAPTSPEERQSAFLQTAAGHLSAGRNVVVCPEGTSVPTKESPVAFRAGSFRLARFARPEPLVVPLAVANFDRKLTQTTTVAMIGEPFRVSDPSGPTLPTPSCTTSSTTTCNRWSPAWSSGPSSWRVSPASPRSASDESVPADPPRRPPEGFEPFWRATLDELDAIAPRVVSNPVAAPAGVQLEALEFEGLGGGRIGAYLARSAASGPRPLIVHGHGYASPGVEVRLDWVRAGADVCGIDVRGYGRSAAALAAGSAAGYVLTGAESPQRSVLRGAVCDHLRGIEIARGLCGPATSRLVVQGTSFAGGLATIAQALRPSADLLVLRVPSLAWTQARMELARLGSGAELRRYVAAHPERAEATLETFAFFDALHFAGRVTCPTLVGVGERDEVVPPRTVTALFERLGGPRELMRFPVSHSDSPEEHRWQRFDERWLRLAVDGAPEGFGREA